MDDILTVEEAMAYLKIGRSTILKLTREGQIPARKVGRAWRYTKENLQAYVTDGPITPAIEKTMTKEKKAPTQKPINTPIKNKPTISPKIRPNNDPRNTLKNILKQFNEED